MNKSIILITGASSDIGCELISEIASEDSIIIAHYNDSKDKIERLKNKLDVEIIPIKADFSNENDINALITFMKNNQYIPDKIIHLPALRVKNTRFKDIEWVDFQDQLDIQVKSIVLILKEFLPLMSKKKRGKVIFMLTSYTISIPPKLLSNYVTAKYALLGLMKSLANEYANKSININGISPSMIETEFLSNIPDKIVEFEAEAHPLNRNATPKDIIPLIKFLLSDDSNYMTGLNIPITGGSAF